MGERNFAKVTDAHIITIDVPRNHFESTIVYTLIIFSEANMRKNGMAKAARPKHLFMKKYAMYAPNEPHELTNSPFSFITSPGRGDSIILRSMLPVLINDTNATIINIPRLSKISPTMKFSFSFLNMSNPVTASNEDLVEVFFFLAIFSFISVILCKSNSFF